MYCSTQLNVNNAEKPKGFLSKAHLKRPSCQQNQHQHICQNTAETQSILECQRKIVAFRVELLCPELKKHLPPTFDQPVVQIYSPSKISHFEANFFLQQKSTIINIQYCNQQNPQFFIQSISPHQHFKNVSFLP